MSTVCWYRPVLFCSAGDKMPGSEEGGLHGAIPVEGSWSRPKEATGDMEEPGKALIAVDLDDERGQVGIRVVAEGGGASCGLRRGSRVHRSPTGGGWVRWRACSSLPSAAHFFLQKRKSQNTRASALSTFLPPAKTPFPFSHARVQPS